jgi:hypothetical protein
MMEEHGKNMEVVADRCIDRLDDRHYIKDLVFCTIDQYQHRDKCTHRKGLFRDQSIPEIL